MSRLRRFELQVPDPDFRSLTIRADIGDFRAYHVHFTIGALAPLRLTHNEAWASFRCLDPVLHALGPAPEWIRHHLPREVHP